MSDGDYGHVCAHGQLARSCEVCDLEDFLVDVQEALTRAEAPVRSDGGYLSLAERVRWLHLRGRDRHRERDEARAEVRRLRDERTAMLDVIEAAGHVERFFPSNPVQVVQIDPMVCAVLQLKLRRVYDLIGDDDE